MINPYTLLCLERLEFTGAELRVFSPRCERSHAAVVIPFGQSDRGSPSANRPLHLCLTPSLSPLPQMAVTAPEMLFRAPHSMS